MMLGFRQRKLPKRKAMRKTEVVETFCRDLAFYKIKYC